MTAIYDYRKKRGMKQADLAKQLNVKANCISMWETGKRKPDIIMLKRIAIILGVTTDELLAPISVEIKGA